MNVMQANSIIPINGDLYVPIGTAAVMLGIKVSELLRALEGKVPISRSGEINPMMITAISTSKGSQIRRSIDSVTLYSLACHYNYRLQCEMNQVGIANYLSHKL